MDFLVAVSVFHESFLGFDARKPIIRKVHTQAYVLEVGSGKSFTVTYKSSNKIFWIGRSKHKYVAKSNLRVPTFDDDAVRFDFYFG